MFICRTVDNAKYGESLHTPSLSQHHNFSNPLMKEKRAGMFRPINNCPADYPIFAYSCCSNERDPA